MLQNPWLVIRMSTLIFYIICVVPLTSPALSMQISEVNTKLCQSLCQCTSKTVDCNHQDGLSFIPRNISLDYHQLHISHASFKNRGLSQDNFSTITHLQSLKIVYSKLDSLSDNTFHLMTLLRYMDLSHNQFAKITSRSFKGLHLTNFYLEQNQGGLQILPDMFEGLSVINLHLRSNNISQLSVKPFQRLNIERLYLFNNSISVVDRKFETIFASSEKLLDLTKNPLHCSCALSWFPELIGKWHDVPDFVKITCHSPNYLQDSLVLSLSREKFSCETPSINKISVDVSENFLQLICHAKGNTSPQMSWSQVSPYNSKEIPYHNQITTLNQQSYVSINISKLQNDNSFICRTWNEINSSNQVLVKLKVVDDFFEKLKTPTQFIERNDDNQKPQLPRNPNPLPETHYLFTKQFSILQMIGAVVGTFTSVVVLIFVVCCSQEHIMKKNSNSNTYWTTIPPDLKNPYNRVVTKSLISPSMAMVTSSNSQDYDIPHESNTFLQSFYTDGNIPHYTGVNPTNF